MAFFGLFNKKPSTDQQQQDLKQGIEKTQQNIFSKLGRAIAGKSTVDDAVLDEIEEALITADVGVDTTVEIINALEEKVKQDKYLNTNELYSHLKQIVSNFFNTENTASFLSIEKEVKVVMVVGVNGVGKTTTIGKLAHQLKQSGQQVVLGAADTFRAAAIEQLDIWAQRAEVEIIKKEAGADPASVTFDTLQAAVARNADVVLIDTAGRLHNKVNLMNELNKVKRVMAKVIPDAPHEVLLVLDASTGQNALEQAKQFMEATNLTGIVLTKLDGTAKGGIILTIANQLNIPIRYIGVGEQMDQLQAFDPNSFVDALFEGYL